MCIFLGSVFYSKNIKVPENGVYPVSVVYNQDESLVSFAQNLEDNHVVKSASFFRSVLIAFGYDRKIKPNEYIFNQPLNVFLVAQKIGLDASKAKGLKVVIPEGSTNKEIKNILLGVFPKFSKDTLNTFFKKEGYFFPDTYFFSINSTEESIALKLQSTFDRKVEDLRKTAVLENKNFDDIVIMASLLEKEGRTSEERKVISGILWKRIEIGMPLQVDATFLYTLDKGSSELTLDDLQADNPYNTYTNTGLPIGPINNPGLATIEAALHPEKSPYLFYLHDKDGLVHYAKNFEEHKRNKAKYLR